MIEDIPWELLINKFSSKLTSEEEVKFQNWLLLKKENLFIYNQLKDYYSINKSFPLDFKPDEQQALCTVQSRLSAEKSQLNYRLSFFAKIAASILVCIVLSWFLFEKPLTKKNILIVVDQQSGVKKVQLPDGSLVWLRNHTCIKYNQNFNKSRDIYLDGEAYFEVAHNKELPFRVFAGKSQTTVVGTKFYLHTNTRIDAIELSVTEGKVIFGANSTSNLSFTKGEQGIFFTKTYQVLKNQTIDINTMAWNTHIFYFDNESLSVVLGKLSEVYNFQYSLEDETLKSYAFTAKFNQRSLSEIFQTIAIVTKSKISKSNNTYIIKPL